MKNVANLILNSKNLVILSHIHPDGDAIGSCLALQLALEQMDKHVECVFLDEVPTVFRFLKNSQKIKKQLPLPENIDLYLVLDAGDLNRTGFNLELSNILRHKKLIFIDHHPKGDLTRIATACIHQENTSSTAELIYELILYLDLKITQDIATALLTGIFTDTGGFQHPNTSTHTLEIAAELMRRGGKLNRIVREIAKNKSLSGLKLLGTALERLRLSQNGRCAVSVLTYADILAAKATNDDLAGIIGNLNTLENVKMSLLITEAEEGIIRGSLRTADKSKISVNKLANILGGGGHARAAGFSLKGRIIIKGERWNIVA